MIWYLHRYHTCAQGKNFPIVERHQAKSSQQFRMVHGLKIFRFLIWCWFRFVACSLNVLFKLNNAVFILKNHSPCVFQSCNSFVRDIHNSVRTKEFWENFLPFQWNRLLFFNNTISSTLIFVLDICQRSYSCFWFYWASLILSARSSAIVVGTLVTDEMMASKKSRSNSCSSSPSPSLFSCCLLSSLSRLCLNNFRLLRIDITQHL